MKMDATMDNWDEFIDFVNAQIDAGLITAKKKNYGMKLAIEELISNIIRANKDTAATVFLEVISYKPVDNKAAVLLQTKDNGAHFDPQFDQVTDDVCSTPIEQRKIGGLGLFLVKNSVDQVAYHHLENCNIYRLLSEDTE